MPRFFLTGTMGPTPLRFPLRLGTLSVGRTHERDIVINDSAISRHHAEIIVEEAAVKVRDLDSLNGTMVNGKKVIGEASLFLGDRLQFGQASLTLREEEERKTPLGGFSGVTTQDMVMPTLTTSLKEIQQHGKTDRGERLMAVISEAGQLLSRSMELDEIYANVLDLMEKVLPVNRILILEADVEEQKVIASRTKSESADTPLRMSKTMLRSILEDGKSFVTADAATDQKWDANQSIVQLGVRAAMGAPLFDNDRILGVLYVDAQHGGVTYQEDDLRLLTLLANMVAVKMTNSRLEAEERALETLRQELTLAAKIQRNLLPASSPEITDYEIFAHQEPCDDIGGDLYDLHLLPDGKLWVVLGDVTGHGIAAALLMSHVMAGLHILEDRCESPMDLVKELEAFLAPRVEMGQFVTLFAGLLDPGTGHMEYVNAGGMPPILLGPEEQENFLTTGPPVAILGQAQERTAAEATLKRGQRLLLFSDGIAEFSKDNVQYDEGRFQLFLEQSGLENANTMGSLLLKDLHDFSGGDAAEDDVTLLIIQRD